MFLFVGHFEAKTVSSVRAFFAENLEPFSDLADDSVLSSAQCIITLSGACNNRGVNVFTV